MEVMKPKIKLFLIASISFLLAILLCRCKIDCPAFPPELARYYFPYVEGSVLSFHNEQNDTLVLSIQNTNITKEFSFTRNCKCECGALFSFQTNNANQYNIEIGGGISIGGNRDYSKDIYTGMRCYIHKSNISSDGFYIENNTIDPFTTEDYAIFGDTLIMENNQQKLTIIKGKGITEWTTQDGEVWRLIE
jgi:hypothetical protein